MLARLCMTNQAILQEEEEEVAAADNGDGARRRRKCHQQSKHAEMTNKHEGANKQSRGVLSDD